VVQTEQRATLDLLKQVNQKHASRYPADTELEARTRSYDLAYRMQVAAPEAVDLKQETAATRAMYGIGEKPTDEYGTAVLRARRLVERGVRFVHVISGTQEEGIQSWDAHQEIEKNHAVMSKTVDKPIGALLRDLKARGLLDSTLVVWTSEFGPHALWPDRRRPRPQSLGLHELDRRRRHQAGHVWRHAMKSVCARRKASSTPTTCRRRCCSS
jgi:membrane-anchored protein YejM (alkaline phosphatase superfamily)